VRYSALIEVAQRIENLHAVDFHLLACEFFFALKEIGEILARILSDDDDFGSRFEEIEQFDDIPMTDFF
jgi:hypothetical protein